MSSALLLTNNSTSTTVAANGSVNLGSAVHGFGRAIQLNNGVITLNGTGYYRIQFNMTAEPDAAGDFTTQMYFDGVAVPGALATVTAVADSQVNIGFEWVTRKSCCVNPASITFVTSAAATVNNVIVEVEKL